jgi:dTDP-4-dehydrorhamnose reductase
LLRPKIVILGGAGMLGHKVFQTLREGFPGTVATTRKSVAQPPLNRVSLLQGPDVVSGIDAGDFESLRARLREWQPDVVVNCVGVIKQRDSAKHAVTSLTINSLLPHRLAEAASEWGGRIIHFSTDCVFSGRKGMYTEEDPSDADDLYGKSKYLGEVGPPNALTLRTSIIGRALTEHVSLLDWFLSRNGGTVRGFRRVIYSGITTNEMATVVARIISDHPELSGTFHVASEPISKFGLLSLIRDAYDLDITIAPDDQEVCDRSMRGERFTAVTGWCAPSWLQMVRRLAADKTPYGEWGIRMFERERAELGNV